MNRHEEGALGDPVLAGNPVYDPDGRRCTQTSSSGRQASVSGQADMVTWPAARAQAKQAGPNAWSRSRLPTGQTLGRSDCSMDSMRVEIMHVWNTPGKGSFRRECVVIKSSPIDHGYIITAKCVSA
jgi:hypothetical protein